jgi:TonB family protein
VQKHPESEASAGFMPPAAPPRAAENLVLLTQDASLTEVLASVVPADSLTVVADEASLANHLMIEPAGVVFIDAGTGPAQAAVALQLTQRLHSQLPDVVLVVAGDGAAQSELAGLVTDGTIYRFVHKPVSAQRAKLFVEAAWRKREGVSSGASGVYQALSLSAPPLPPLAPMPRVAPWPAIGTGVVLAAAAAAWFFLHAYSTSTPDSTLQAAPQPPLAAPPAAAPPTLNAPAPAPAVAPALRPPSQAAELDRLATAAEQALLAGNLGAAARLTEAARAVDPNHVRVKFLTAQIQREQAQIDARRRAAQAAAPQTVVAAPVDSASVTVNAPPPPVAAAAVSTRGAEVAPTIATSVTVSSTPPVSEAHDPHSVAAVILDRVYSVDPEFPEIAREQDLAGFVDLEFMVHTDGSVSDVAVLKAQPLGVFEKSAVAAVRQWRYRPVERGGVPVDEHARLRLNFGYKSVP